MHQTHIEEIFESLPFVEAAVHVGQEGLPLAGRSRCGASIEEISSVAAGLFSFGLESGLVPERRTAQLSVAAEHGIMLIRMLPDATFLLLLITGGCPLNEIESALDHYFFGREKITQGG
jgi:predicted regulator of Ras-like GTPase activity (Roadblock/LC7/MglB family)